MPLFLIFHRGDLLSLESSVNDVCKVYFAVDGDKACAQSGGFNRKLERFRKPYGHSKAGRMPAVRIATFQAAVSPACMQSGGFNRKLEQLTTHLTQCFLAGRASSVSRGARAFGLPHAPGYGKCVLQPQRNMTFQSVSALEHF